MLEILICRRPCVWETLNKAHVVWVGIRAIHLKSLHSLAHGSMAISHQFYVSFTASPWNIVSSTKYYWWHIKPCRVKPRVTSRICCNFVPLAEHFGLPHEMTYMSHEQKWGYMGTRLSQLQLQISGTPCLSASDSHRQLHFLKSSLKHTCLDWLFNLTE